MDSRFVRKVFEVSSHQVATGVLHLLQMVELVRIEGKICPHSMQYMVFGEGARVETFGEGASLMSGRNSPRSVRSKILVIALANYKWAWRTKGHQRFDNS